MFEYSFLAIICSTIILSTTRVADSAPSPRSAEPTASQLLQRFLDSLIKDSPNIQNRKHQTYEDEEEIQRPKYRSYDEKRIPKREREPFREPTTPAPAPPPPVVTPPAASAQVQAPAAYYNSYFEFDSAPIGKRSTAVPTSQPVSWPFPPAPTHKSDSEFPLLERFLSNNRNNYQSNQIQPKPVQSPPEPQRQTHTHTQTHSITYPQTVTERHSNTYLQTPTQKPLQIYYPQTTPAPALAAAYDNSMLPPPLSPHENHWIEKSKVLGQPRYFNLDTIRLNDGENPNLDKLNVSFVMPPNVRPLSLNFDSGDMVVDFGENAGKYERISGKDYKSKIPDLNELFGVQSKPNKQKISEENDDEYIIVRHDMNKYAYDMPRGSAGAQSSEPAQPSEPLNSEKYEVSNVSTNPKKRVQHFVLGRV